MVQEIPTFRSTATTQIPSMGTVSQSGTRAMAQAFQNIGVGFGKIADIQFEKTQEKVLREQKKLGVEYALSKGFDVSELEEPQTVADQAFRASALETYKVKLENDISTNINNLHVGNLRNPDGFAQKSDEFIKGTVSKLPFELKAGATQYAQSLAQTKFAQINMEVTKKRMAETDAAQTANINDISDKIVLERDPEEKQVLMQRLQTAINQSTLYLTPEAKEAAYRQQVDTIIYDDQFQSVARGDTTPMEAMDTLAGSGIALDSTKINQLYSAINQKQNFDENQVAMNEKRRTRGIRDNSNAAVMQAYDMSNSGATEQEFTVALENSLKQLRASGATFEEISNHKEQMRDAYYNITKTDNDNAVVNIDQMIFDGDDEAIETINNYFNRGLITAATRQSKLEKAETDFSEPIRSPIFKDFINNNYIPQYAPNASYTAADVSNMNDVALKEQVEADKAKVEEVKRKFINLINDEEKPMSFREAVQSIDSDLRANSEPVPVAQKVRVPASSPVGNKIQQILNTDNFVVYGFNERGGRREFDSQDHNFLDGRWTQENFEHRLRFMILQNQRAVAAGKQELYDEAVLEGILNAFRR